MPRGRKKTLTPALEDYLAVIQEILQKQPAARVSVIARKMGVSLPSVTNAMKRLSELGYVEYEKYGYITLTEKGKRKARSLRGSQNRLRNFFFYVMGIPSPTAEKLARHFSHFLDTKTRSRFKKFYDIMVNFDESKVQELKEFLEESKRIVNVQEIPEEAKNIEEEEEEA
ncbi:metal-dependent transcriptional regulator [Thermotoga sp. KOL6]|uniref:metal-dependent transcriptional regulator n=1 Tax=Thermotoga sp. KOL6 TaxID=126741 RepID=UPI000C75C247|nr:metal-dependent transcriptional regulator [Thermotoga sp. KOL6]PLV59229.1 Fur family transcriptional regulator [Thermotoga sp. KOL6]